MMSQEKGIKKEISQLEISYIFFNSSLRMIILERNMLVHILLQKPSLGIKESQSQGQRIALDVS